MRSHAVAVLAGDGIGPEVIDATRPALAAVADRFGFELKTTDFPLGAQHYLATGELLTPALVEQLRGFDAILFGAMGDPTVKPGILERGIIIAMRLAFQQAANVRPVRLYPGVESPIKNVTTENCDLVIVRENTEGAYVGSGSTVLGGTPHAVATQDSVNTWFGIERVVDFAFRLATQRRNKVTLAHKKNVLLQAGGLWQEVVDTVAQRYPHVEHDYVHADAMCFHLPLDPGRFDVVVTDNLMGDIITDLGAVVQGGLGVSASANLNVAGDAPSMFEPIHGSAPDIAGKGWANPVGTALSASLMLASLGESEAASALEAATIQVLGELPGPSGPAMGCTTAEVGERIAAAVTAGAVTIEGAPTLTSQLAAALRG